MACRGWSLAVGAGDDLSDSSFVCLHLIGGGRGMCDDKWLRRGKNKLAVKKPLVVDRCQWLDDMKISDSSGFVSA